MRKLCLWVALFSLLASGAVAQTTGDWSWVPLDNEPEGSKSQLLLDRQRSNASETFIELRVHGYWARVRQDPGGNSFTEINVPGMGSTQELGAPRTPVMHFAIAIPEGQKEQPQANGEWLQVNVTEQSRVTHTIAHLWPRVIPSTDQAPPGQQDVSSPEEFRMDVAIYGGNQYWPGDAPIRSLTSKQRLRSIESAEIQVSPARWNPSNQELDIAHSLSLHIRHPMQQAQPAEPITFDREKLARLEFANWKIVENLFPIDRLRFRANYLIIYPNAGYADEIEPFADQKRARGYAVTEMRVTEIGGTCEEIRAAIQAWELLIPIWRDAYALLVGDTDVIPLCTSPTGDPTDDLYASTNGDDQDEEIFLGRLSVNNETDLENQIQKILAYEDNPSLFCCYNEVGLWAHKEGAPGKYEGAHETVRTNTYTVPPSFTTYYGSQAGVGDAQVVGKVDSGVGVMAYRGHGNEDATGTGWNQVSDFFDGADVGTLSNASPRTPVLWSFACSNSDLDQGGSCAGGDCGSTSADDSIAEIWMEKPDSASVSYYGSTVPSFTDENHILDEWMHLAVYDEGLTKQSHAIRRAEAQMSSLVSDNNAWMYLLLGDPDMDVRRRNPGVIRIQRPEVQNTCGNFGCILDFQVFDEFDNVIPDALISLWKDDPYGQSDGEVFINGYTDSEGRLQLLANSQSEGEIRFSVRVAGESIQQNTGAIPVIASAVPLLNPFGIIVLLGVLLGSGLVTLRSLRHRTRRH